MSTGSIARSFTLTARAAASPSLWAPSAFLLSSAARLAVAGPHGAGSTGLTPVCPSHQFGGRRSYSAMPTQGGPAPTRKKRTIMDLHAFKRRKVPITVLTAHDYPSARFIESTSSPSPSTASSHPQGIDIALVGDSLAMVACGYSSTTPLTMDELLFHCRSVARGCTTSFLVADMPFGSYTISPEQAILNATRLMQEGNMDAVKLEGGLEVCETIRRLTEVGIPVMAHVGLTPQRHQALSGFRVQGKTAKAAEEVLRDALAVEKAGAFSVVVEAVPSRVAAVISDKLMIPTIGIGAGKGCDGQVLVQMDMLGINSMDKGPKFVKRYAELEKVATDAVREYVREVREGVFPDDGKHGYTINDEEFEAFAAAVKTSSE